MRNLITSKYFYLIIAMVATLCFSQKAIQPDFSDFTITTPSGQTSPTEFPFFKASAESGVYRLHGFVDMGKYASSNMRIIPDDEILSLIINHQTVDLSMIPYEARRDYSKGFTYDLAAYLKPGKNELELLYSDGGGLMGIIISAEGSENFYTFFYALLIAITLLISTLIIKPLKLRVAIKVLFIGALFIRLAYFMATPPDLRDHDMGDHIGYTEYLTTHWLPPPIDYATGGAFFHPPLYYYTGAVVYTFTQWIEPYNKVAIYRVQQLLSLAYGMGFVFFGLLILNELLERYKPKMAENEDEDEDEDDSQLDSSSTPEKKSYLSLSYWCAQYKQDQLFWTIGALFAFWPVAVVHSVRIGNDPMLYCFFAASLFYIIRWYHSDKKRDLLIASILGAIAIVTKANGEILVAVLGVIGLYKMIKTQQWLDYCKLAIAPCLIMFIAVGITITPGLILNLEGKRDKLYIDNLDGISTANLVGNTASNYLWFDAKIFITEPYADPYDDRMGRQFFWNYLAKTGLIGEFKYPKAISTNLAVILSFIALLMMLYTLVGIFHLRKIDFKRSAPILLSGFFLWAGVTYMRMTFPANIDFRYIVPILITICALYAMSIINFQRIGATRLANLGLSLATMFTLSGILFVLALL